jgi:hypothetical protein
MNAIKKDPKVETLGSTLELVELLFESGGLACASAHKVELRTSDLTMALDHDFIQAWGAEQKGAFDTDPVGSHASNSDGRFRATFSQPNDDSFELLNALALTLFDFHMHTDSVASGKLRNFFILLGFESLNNI